MEYILAWFLYWKNRRSFSSNDTSHFTRGNIKDRQSFFLRNRSISDKIFCNQESSWLLGPFFSMKIQTKIFMLGYLFSQCLQIYSGKTRRKDNKAEVIVFYILFCNLLHNFLNFPLTYYLGRIFVSFSFLLLLFEWEEEGMCVSVQEYLGAKEEEANLHNHYHWCRNIDNIVHHGLQEAIKTFHSISLPSYDIWKEETEHHLQQHGPSVQTTVYTSKI